jgi:hypothetical protein
MDTLSWRSPRSCLALSRDPDGSLIARRLWPGGSTPWRVVALLAVALAEVEGDKPACDLLGGAMAAPTTQTDREPLCPAASQHELSNDLIGGQDLFRAWSRGPLQPPQRHEPCDGLLEQRQERVWIEVGVGCRDGCLGGARSARGRTARTLHPLSISYSSL